MEAKELRIGNYVSQYNKVISGITSNSIHKFDLGLIILEPIPLTEEIMLSKFGAKKTKNGFLYKKFYLFESYNNRWMVRESIKLWDITIMNTITEIKFLHEWQNLYFALEGKELTIINKDSDRILLININMSTRLLNCLRSAGIDYLDELSEFSLYKISKIRHIGKKTLSELQEIMSKNNIKFKQ